MKFLNRFNEGSHTGVPSVFIRLQGCPVGCPWCDTQHTWPVAKEDIIAIETLRSKRADAPTHAQFSPDELLSEYSLRDYQA